MIEGKIMVISASLSIIYQKITTNTGERKHCLNPPEATQFFHRSALTALVVSTVLVIPRHCLTLLKKTISVLTGNKSSGVEKIEQVSAKVKHLRYSHESLNNTKDLQRLVLVEQETKKRCKNLTRSLSTDSEKRRSSTENSSMESEKEESIASTSSESSTSSKVDTLNQVKFIEINKYLEQLENNADFPVNGILSRAMNGFLKQLRSHLKAKTASRLQVIHEQRIKEICEHLLIGSAGLELIVQAIYDQRFSHIALGFRSALMHCHYAIEQTLDHLIMLKTDKFLDKIEDHDLTRLAEKAQITDKKKWEVFLKEITLHLAFSYPKDHQIFFQESNTRKAFSLLEDLCRISLNKKEIEEAVKFCFEMYLKSISFIIEVSSAQIKYQKKNLAIIQELQGPLIKRLYASCAKKPIEAKQIADPLTEQVDKALSYLESLDAYLCIENRKVYAAFETIKSYLQLMKISLEIPQASSKHSLQRFIKIETIAHADKLFKHLFRTIILVKKEYDDHHHNLIALFDSINFFYEDIRTIEIIKYLLKEINISSGHHYLFTRNNSSRLKMLYNKALKEAHTLIDTQDDDSLSEEGYSVSGKSFCLFTKNANEIVDLISTSFHQFLDLLERAKRIL